MKLILASCPKVYLSFLKLAADPPIVRQSIHRWRKGLIIHSYFIQCIFLFCLGLPEPSVAGVLGWSRFLPAPTPTPIPCSTNNRL